MEGVLVAALLILIHHNKPNTHQPNQAVGCLSFFKI